MGLKVLTSLIISVEFLLIGFVLFDLHTSVFTGFKNGQEDEEYFALNTTVEDPKTVEMGKFAVDEYNKATKSGLIFEKVVRAVYEQSSHMMLIQVIDQTSSSKLYGAVVMVQGDSRGLVAFEEAT